MNRRFPRDSHRSPRTSILQKLRGKTSGAQTPTSAGEFAAKTSRRSRWVSASFLSLFVAVFLAMLLAVPLLKFAVRANPPDLQAIARAYPNFTAAQHQAILRQLQSSLHPMGRDLTFSAWVSRFAKFLTAANSSGEPAPAANFTGNLTAVAVNTADMMALAQQPDCSLNLDDWVYTLNPSALTFSYTLGSSTPNYQRVLHTAAGLTTTQGKYAAGCGNTGVGVTSRKIIFTGVTTGGIRVYATHVYDNLLGADQIFTVTSQTNDAFQKTTKLNDPNYTIDLATADLNSDGNGDLVAIDNSLTSGANAIATIFLGNADGSFAAPTQIALQGTNASSAVIDDFNGDGKKDLVVSTYSFPVGPGTTTYYINVLLGNGDGTFKPLQSYTETPPAAITPGPSSVYFGLISAQLRSSGHKDLITSSGIVLSGNGDGTFTQFPTVAFPLTTATSSWGPNVVAADFNKDGKPDLALNNGETIQIFLGNGDDTFTPKSVYSAVGNVGYMVAQDLDGDGNVDLYSGAGNNGSVGGDQIENNMGYALMGNGDGTFRGAPSEPFSYTGTNLGDLTGHHHADAVSVSGNSFASYLNDGIGNFTAGSTFAYSPITLGGTQYTFNSGLDSYAVGDINGDGFADVVYLATDFYGPNFTPGIFVATGKGDGSFNPPVFVPAPAFIRAPGDFDVNPTISGVRLADFNNDGKLDLIYTYATTSDLAPFTNYFGVAVQLGNGNGTFQTTSQLTQLYSGATLPNPGAYQIGLVGKVNTGDVFPDMLVLSGLSGNSQSFTLQVFLGTGTGAFGAPTTVTGVTPGGIEYGTEWAPLLLADMNNDTIPDIVALQMDTNTGNLQVAIALGNGNGTFKAPSITEYGSQYLNGTGLAVADFNADGNLDVATISTIVEPSASGISFGNGDGTLQTGGTAPNLTTAQSLYVGGFGAAIAMDLNGDGKPDILSDSVELLNQPAPTVTTPATSSTALISSLNPSISGQQVTFTATVTSGTSGTPTGTVTFSDGSTQIGSGLLNSQAVATFQTSSLSAGSHSITATYGGDSNFATSASTALTENVTGFGPVPNPAAPPVTAGQNATINLTVFAVGGSFNLACSGLPAKSSCQFTPNPVTGSTSGTPVQLIFSTSSSALPVNPSSRPPWPWSVPEIAALMASLAVLAAGGMILLRLAPRPRRRLAFGLGLAVVALAVVLAGCGGAGSSGTGSGSGSSYTGTPKGLATFTVTATSGATVITAPVSVTVQ